MKNLRLCELLQQCGIRGTHEYTPDNDIYIYINIHSKERDYLVNSLTCKVHFYATLDHGSLLILSFHLFETNVTYTIKWCNKMQQKNAIDIYCKL